MDDTPFKDIWHGDFDSFCADKSLTTSQLLDAYADMFHRAFFRRGVSESKMSDEQLERWLNWCLYYGRPREDYPLAGKD